MNRDHVQPGRHDLLQIFEGLGPGKGFALEKVVEELGAVAGAAVLGQVQQSLRVGFFLVAGGALLFVLPHELPVFASADPSVHGHAEQQ